MPVAPIRHNFIFILILILMLNLCLSGCKNPFRTRESPPPIISEGTWETPSQPEIVIQNLLYAYNERIIGNFIQCLADSFRFSAPEDSLDAVNQGRTDLFAGWDRSVELSVTTRIFDISRQYPDSISYVLSFDLTPPVPDDIGDSLSTLSREYELLTISGKTAPPESTLAKGIATFWMRETSLNWWSIYLWKDIAAVANSADWADFKAQFRQ
ncbi:MAG TPA: hypothetical protein VF369_00915 [candidate division Zixibacteria bacterium]